MSGIERRTMDLPLERIPVAEGEPAVTTQDQPFERLSIAPSASDTIAQVQDVDLTRRLMLLRQDLAAFGGSTAGEMQLAGQFREQTSDWFAR